METATNTNRVYGTQGGPNTQGPTARKSRQAGASSLIGASTSAKQTTTPTRDQIARRAYEIWLSRGCEQGRDVEHWTEAERQLRRR